MAATSIAPAIAVAKDIKNEQRQAYEARERYNDTKSKHEKLMKKISKKQEELTELINEEAAAKLEVEKSKANLEAKTQQLNDVWDSRHD